MEGKKIVIQSEFDQKSLHCIFYAAENAKATIQIIHGMKEHQNRYKYVAERLNMLGYNVITSDMRGHGANTQKEEFGYMGENTPWNALIIDQVSITKEILSYNGTLKIYLLAHSMGTIICRNLLQEYDYFYDKVILSGVPAYQLGAKFGKVIASIISTFKGNNHVSNMLESMTLKPFSKAVKNYKTENDWISYNEDNVKCYNEDHYCGIPFTVSAYKALYYLNVQMQKSKAYGVKKKELPILLLAGEDDPCTLGTKGLKRSMAPLIKAGYTNVTLKVYPKMRHEIMNEIKRDDVIEDIINFYK